MTLTKKKTCQCGREFGPDDNFCINCGLERDGTSIACTNCKQILEPEDIYCRRCGFRIDIDKNKFTTMDSTTEGTGNFSCFRSSKKQKEEDSYCWFCGAISGSGSPYVKPPTTTFNSSEIRVSPLRYINNTWNTETSKRYPHCTSFMEKGYFISFYPIKWKRAKHSPNLEE